VAHVSCAVDECAPHRPAQAVASRSPSIARSRAARRMRAQWWRASTGRDRLTALSSRPVSMEFHSAEGTPRAAGAEASRSATQSQSAGRRHASSAKADLARPGAARGPAWTGCKAALLDTVEEAFRSHRQTLYCYLRRRTRCSADAEELTQDVFADAVAAVREARPPRCVEAWLYTTARRRLVDYLRRTRSDSAWMLSAEAVEVDADTVVLAQAVVRSIAQLRFVDRQLVVMRFIQGRTTAEIAATLGMTEAACRMRLARARHEVAAKANQETPAHGASTSLRTDVSS
jgi:RNA polymerase sigma-70 factor (ECF subfamily)